MIGHDTVKTRSCDAEGRTKERHAGGVDGLQLNQVLFEMVLTQIHGVLQDFPFPLWYGLERRGKKKVIEKK